MKGTGRMAAGRDRSSMGMVLSMVTVYAGGYLFLVFFAVCLATGLYYVAELVEEYARLTKKVISYAIKGIIGLHLLLLVVDRLPILCIAVGIGSHIAYHRMLKTFPYMSVTSTEFLASVGMLVLSHVTWFRFFLLDPKCRYVTVEWVMGFLLINVWLVPFTFFISLAANESVLPMGSYPGYVRSEADPTHMGGVKRTRGTLLGLFNFLRKKRDEVLPSVTSRIPGSYLGKNDKPL